MERGRDIDYVEDWHRDDGGSVVPIAALALRCAETGVNASLLQVGAHFIFARDRMFIRLAESHLPECVVGPSDVDVVRDFVDCEISFWSMVSSGYRINATTLPYRVGALLGQFLTEIGFQTQDLAADGTMFMRVWDIMGRDGTIDILEPADFAAN